MLSSYQKRKSLRPFAGKRLSGRVRSRLRSRAVHDRLPRERCMRRRSICNVPGRRTPGSANPEPCRRAGCRQRPRPPRQRSGGRTPPVSTLETHALQPGRDSWEPAGCLDRPPLPHRNPQAQPRPAAAARGDPPSGRCRCRAVRGSKPCRSAAQWTDSGSPWAIHGPRPRGCSSPDSPLPAVQRPGVQALNSRRPDRPR
jgi:hypothetical protein